VLENLFPYGPPRRAGLTSPSRARDRARDVLTALGLADVPWHIPLGRLDLADRQLVEISRALLGRPRVLVLDDPTRGVDIGARAEMHGIVRELRNAGRTVLVASTDLAELAELCDRVLVFQRGRIVRELSGDALTEHTLGLAMNAGFAGTRPSPGTDTGPNPGSRDD
jgi:ABC-type sugar transport system ATPase subunit